MPNCLPTVTFRSSCGFDEDPLFVLGGLQLLETAKASEAKAMKEGAKYTFDDCERRQDYYQQPLIAVE